MLVTPFIEQGLPGWLRFAMVLTNDARDADDICADVAGRVFEQWPKIEAAQQPNAYVKRMIVNEFISRKRRGRWSTPVAHLEHLAGSLADHAETHAEQDALNQRLARLAPRQRAAIVLRFYEGLSDDDIAEVLTCRTGTVRSLISRALRSLRIDLGDDADRAPGPTTTWTVTGEAR